MNPLKRSRMLAIVLAITSQASLIGRPAGAQSTDVIQERGKAVGIRAGYECTKKLYGATSIPLPNALDKAGISKATKRWALGIEGEMAVEAFSKEALTDDCKNAIDQSDQEAVYRIGLSIGPYLVDDPVDYAENNKETLDNESRKYFADVGKFRRTNRTALLIIRGDKEKAEGRYQDSIKSYEMALDDEDYFSSQMPLKGWVLVGLGMAYEGEQEYLLAQQNAEKGLLILTEELGESSDRTLFAMNVLTNIANKQGDHAKAISIGTNALKILNQNKDASKSRYKELLIVEDRLLHTLAVISLSAGNKEKAIAYSDQRIKHLSEHFPENKLGVANTLQIKSQAEKDKDKSYVQTANEAKASLENLLIAYQIKKQELGDNHPDTLFVRSGLAFAYSSLNDYGKSVEIYKEILPIYEEIYGLAHEKSIYIRHMLIGALVNNEKTGNALDVALRDLGIIEQEYGKISVEYLLSSKNITFIRYQMGGHEHRYTTELKDIKQGLLALGAVEKADEIETQLISRDDTLRNQSLDQIRLKADRFINENIGNQTLKDSNDHQSITYALVKEKDHKRVLELLKKHALISVKTLGSSHPLALNNQLEVLNYAAVHSDNPKLALDGLKRLKPAWVQAFSGDTGKLWQINSTLENAAFFSGNTADEIFFGARAIELGLKYLVDYLALAPSAMRLEMVAKFSLPFDKSYTYMTKINKSSDLEGALLAGINRAGLLSELERNFRTIRSEGLISSDLLEELRSINTRLGVNTNDPEEKERLMTRKLNIESRLFNEADIQKPVVHSAREISGALPSNSGLVIYKKYWNFDLDTSKEGSYYMAILISSEGNIQIQKLGTAEEINTSIRQLYSGMSSFSAGYKYHSGQVYKQVLAPIREFIDGKERVIIVADGLLHKAPFPLLAQSDGADLFESTKLTFLSNPREVMHLKKAVKESRSQPVIIVNPAYGPKQLNSNGFTASTRDLSQESKSDSELLLRSGQLQASNWVDLPSTKKEGAAVQAQIGGLLLQGLESNKANIQSISSPSVLHIATHAYFIEPTTDDDSAVDDMGLENPSFNSDEALIRSGIVLAGANQQLESGYMSALDFSQLDLTGTQLVVLSACETGLGDISSGEGLYGLQRAIALAGARSSLLSLWKVDDAATAAFMKSFYGFLSQGLDKDVALKKTQDKFKNHPIPRWQHPYVWAAFRLTGDWSPIQGLTTQAN